MKKIFAFILLASVCAQADFLDLPMSEVVGADLVCGHPGGGYALKMTSPQKIWQIDGDKLAPQAIGLDMSDVNITVDGFEGRLDTIKVVGKFTAATGSPEAVKVTVYDLSNKSEEIGSITVNCSPVTK